MTRGAPTLLATTIFVLQEGGNYKQFYRGEAVPGLNDEQVERLTKCGALGKAADLDAEPQLVVPVSDPLGEAESDVVVEGVAKPDRDAGKPDLVTWVVDNLVHDDESPYTKSEASRLNKDDLWDLIDSATSED